MYLCVVGLDFKETEKEMTHKVKVDLVLALLKIVVWLLGNYFAFLDLLFLTENLETGSDDSLPISYEQIPSS